MYTHRVGHKFRIISYNKTMSRTRRTWSPQEKANIVLEILREESTLVEISKKYDIAQPVLSRWKADFVNNMSSVFDKKGEDMDKIIKEHEEEKEILIKKSVNSQWMWIT